jgi:CDP-paratose 2-epimerase
LKVLVTGCGGLVGSECVRYFDAIGHKVTGVENDSRKKWFGEEGTVCPTLRFLLQTTNLNLHAADIRYYSFTDSYDLIIHAAAQPSHDKAREIPVEDFDVNAMGTLRLLEQTRKKSPNAVFVFLSTNKVYGDAPNGFNIREFTMRYDAPTVYECCPIDQSTHSIFGASKLAADIMVQEYAKTYGLKTVCFRCGCLTGKQHAGVELHGFLSYMAKVARRKGVYKIYGYKGKQVRDNLHAFDVVKAIEAFYENPRPGEVYNLGGGRANSISVIEAAEYFGVQTEYVDEARLGDHICYISDLTKFQNHYPQWKVTRSLDSILKELK